MKNIPITEAWKILRKCRNGSSVLTVQHPKVIAAAHVIGAKEATRYLSQPPKRPRTKRELRRGQGAT